MAGAAGACPKVSARARRARTDLVALIGRDLDLEPSGSVLKARSPKHRDTDPSFVVFPHTQTWHDFSGGGDCLDYLVQHRGLSFMEALRALAAETGVPIPGWSPEEAEIEAKRVVERRRIEALLTEAAGYYHRVLPSKIRRELYRGGYGFTDATIDQLQLGWGGGDLFEHLTETCGASREEALATGLFVLAGGEVRELFRWRLVLPYWRANCVVYFIARRAEYTPDDPWEQAKYKMLLTHGDKHRYVSPELGNDYFFGEDAAREGGELLICEGITDATSAMQAGVPCISPVTVRFRKQDHDKLIALTSRAIRVVICNVTDQRHRVARSPEVAGPGGGRCLPDGQRPGPARLKAAGVISSSGRAKTSRWVPRRSKAQARYACTGTPTAR